MAGLKKQVDAEVQAPPTPVRLWLIHMYFVLSVPVFAMVYAFGLSKQPGISTSMPTVAESPLAWGLLLLSLLSMLGGIFLPKHIVAADASREKTADATSAEAAMSRGSMLILLSDGFFEISAVYGLVGVRAQLPPAASYGLMGLSFVLLLANSLQVMQVVSECRALTERERTP